VQPWTRLLFQTINNQPSTINQRATLDFRLSARAGPNAGAPFPPGKELVLKLSTLNYALSTFFGLCDHLDEPVASNQHSLEVHDN